MKEELARAHASLLVRLDALEELVGVSRPTRDLLSAIRHQLTRASGRRRKLLEGHIYPPLED